MPRKRHTFFHFTPAFFPAWGLRRPSLFCLVRKEMEEKTVWTRNSAYAQSLFYGLRPKNLLAQSSLFVPAKEEHEKGGENFSSICSVRKLEILGHCANLQSDQVFDFLRQPFRRWSFSGTSCAGFAGRNDRTGKRNKSAPEEGVKPQSGQKLPRVSAMEKESASFLHTFF